MLFYAAIRSEVQTEHMIVEALDMGKTVLLPKVNSQDKRLTKHVINGLHEMTPGYMGIPEPNVSEDRKVKLNEIDIVVIPGTGFDKKGNRLGYGGGYYDRLLADTEKEIPKAALAFEEQIVDDIPAEPHDMKMDIIVTDKRVIRC